jgi:hypothetical protein
MSLGEGSLDEYEAPPPSEGREGRLNDELLFIE